MNKVFETQDIVLAASLKIHGYDLVKITKKGNIGTFIFENVDNEFLNNYNLEKIDVSPIQFNNVIKQLTTSVRRMQ